MSRTYGRAFPISWSDVRGYDYVDRRYAPNSRGVTTLAAVNGRGAYGRAFPSARSAMSGMSPADRLRHARNVVGGPMPMRRNPPVAAGADPSKWTKKQKAQWARAVKAEQRAIAKSKGLKVPRTPAQKRHAKREGMFRKYRAKGLSAEKAAARAMTAVPYLKTEKHKTFHGKKARVRRKPPTPRQYKTVRGKRMVKRRVAVPVKRKVRVAYKRYKRVALQHPRTGKKTLSYMYRSGGRLKKIPAWAIAGARSAKDFKSDAFAKQRERTTKRRAAAARRIEKSGGAFTPNRRKKKTMKANRKRTKASRRAAALKGIRRKKAKRSARSAKRPVGYGRGRHGTRLTRGKIYYKGRKPRVLKGKKARKLPKARILLTNRKTRRYADNPRKSTKRSRAAKKGWARRRAKGAARKTTRRRSKRRASRKLTPNRRRSTRKKSRKYASNRKGRKATYAANRKRRKKSRKGSRSRRYTANAFLADLKKLGVVALFATTGFIAHKLLTRVIVDKLLAPALVPTAGLGAGEWKGTLLKWSPVLVGFIVGAAGVAAVGAIAPARRNEVGAGLVVSWVHTTILTLLGMSDSPKVKDAAKWIAGYDTSSTAAAIGRYRRQAGLRGLGQDQTSILPRYAATGRRGGLQQAVAGRGTGEYFQASGMGEYFASGVQGIGSYELAGPLVTQAAAGLGQRIDDGIRPDANLDQVLMLAEAQAGVGEYYSANPGGDLFSVPQQDQWIPNNALWAGTKPAGDDQEASEVPAGILETPGGNGIFG